MTIDSERLEKILLSLLAEAFEGPEDPRKTWFVDHEEGAGFLGTLDRLTAAEASRPFSMIDRASPASHAGHLRFSLNLANRSLRGEKVYSGVDWKKSWSEDIVTEGEWKNLREELRREYLAYREAIAQGLVWTDDRSLTALFAHLAHGAWHLGALRQGLGLIVAPEPTAGRSSLPLP